MQYCVLGAAILGVIYFSVVIWFGLNLADQANGMRECVRQHNRAEDCKYIYKDFIK